MQAIPETLNERFEKKVVFRLARWLPLGLGLLASIALVIAVLVAAYAFLPTFAPAEPGPLEMPKPVSLSTEDIKQAIASPAAKEAPAAEEAAAPAAEEKPAAKSGPDPRAVALGAELGKFHALAQKGGLSFLDVTQTQCVDFSYGQCWSQREVKVREGVGNRVLEVLALYQDEGEHEVEKVSVGNSGLTINVTLDSQVETRTTVLKELNAILAAAPAGKMGQWFDTWMELRQSREQAQRKTAAEAHEKAVEEFQVASQEHEATVEKKSAMRWSSLSALGMALGIFVFCGMVLAVLAIERHSRALRELAELLKGQAPAAPAAPVVQASGVEVPTLNG